MLYIKPDTGEKYTCTISTLVDQTHIQLTIFSQLDTHCIYLKLGLIDPVFKWSRCLMGLGIYLRGENFFESIFQVDFF